MKNVGLVFAKPRDFADPFSVMGAKRPVYEEFWAKCRKANLNLVITSILGYRGDGEFGWFWEIAPGKTKLVGQKIKVDLAYDRSGGFEFPLAGDSLRVVDSLEFKKLAWNKWTAYRLLSEFMPKTYLMKDAAKIAGDWLVLKPIDGLKGKGIYIGPKSQVSGFVPLAGRKYLAQEFIDTSAGIAGIARGLHDLRVAIVNAKIVWSHVRTPPRGEFKSNVAGGGRLKEVDLDLLPEAVRQIGVKVARRFWKRYDNPVFSVDFGLDRSGRPFIFEINDQIGFPRAEMRLKDQFLEELVANLVAKV